MSHPGFSSGTVHVRSTTPRFPASLAVCSLCRRLTSDGKFVLLPFSEVDGSYRAGFCHVNALHRTRNHGGSREFGWVIWEHPGIMVEAEFHAVWRSPAGELIDLTPRVDKEKLAAFVPDTERRIESYEGLDMSWANYSSRSAYSEPTERFLIRRDESLARQMRRLGFSPDEPLS